MLAHLLSLEHLLCVLSCYFRTSGCIHPSIYVSGREIAGYEKRSLEGEAGASPWETAEPAIWFGSSGLKSLLRVVALSFGRVLPVACTEVTDRRGCWSPLLPVCAGVKLAFRTGEQNSCEDWRRVVQK
jgi:hypothetical protein